MIGVRRRTSARKKVASGRLKGSETLITGRGGTNRRRHAVADGRSIDRCKGGHARFRGPDETKPSGEQHHHGSSPHVGRQCGGLGGQESPSTPASQVPRVRRECCGKCSACEARLPAVRRNWCEVWKQAERVQAPPEDDGR